MANVDSTGLDVYLVALGTPMDTKAACTTAIAAGKRIGKVKSLGELGGTRAINEHKYLSNDETEKSVGSISFGSLAIDCPYAPSDTAGQAELRSMFDGKTRKAMIIKETDGNFTTVSSVICSSSMKGYELDNFDIFKATVEINAMYKDVIA